MIQNIIKIPGYSKAWVCHNYLISASEDGVCFYRHPHFPIRGLSTSSL